MAFEDKELDCADCKETFTWEAGEQEFFDRKGFTPPKRCKTCREKSKARREAGGGKPE